MTFSFLQLDGYSPKNKLNLISWHFFCSMPRLPKGHIYMVEKEERKQITFSGLWGFALTQLGMTMASLLHSATPNSASHLWFLKLNSKDFWLYFVLVLLAPSGFYFTMSLHFHWLETGRKSNPMPRLECRKPCLCLRKAFYFYSCC